MQLGRRLGFDAQVAIGAALLGIGNGMLHWQSVDRSWRDYQADEHMRVIAGNFYSPDQYRILTYALAEGLVRFYLLEVIRKEEPNGTVDGTREPAQPRRIVTTARVPARMSK